MKYLVWCPTLPLAVYREVVAHLSQVEGVAAELVVQMSPQFDYMQSQVEGLLIQLPDPASADCQAQVEQILAYYGDRYSPWTERKTEA